MTRYRPRGQRDLRDRGQATVELALLLPVVAMLLLTLVQIGLVVHARVMVTHAAREAVRVAAVGASDVEVRAAAARAGGLDPARTHVRVVRTATLVTVDVRHRFATDLPLAGSLVHDVVLASQASMRPEDSSSAGPVSAEAEL